MWRAPVVFLVHLARRWGRPDLLVLPVLPVLLGLQALPDRQALPDLQDPRGRPARRDLLAGGEHRDGAVR